MRSMRPLVLNPLFASLTSLPGVGPKLEKLYARLLDREAPRVVDLLFHLPSGAVDRRARPKLNEVQAGQLVHRRGHRRRAPAAAAPPAARALPHRHQRRHRADADADLFQRARGLSAQALARGRDALRLRHRRTLRQYAADGASRPRGRRAGLRQFAAGRAGLSADRRARARQCAARDGRGARPACPICRNGRTRPGSRASVFPPSPRRCAICTGRPSRTTSRRKVRPGRGSPTTNCSPASSRSLWSARTCAGRPAAARPAKAACARTS